MHSFSLLPCRKCKKVRAVTQQVRQIQGRKRFKGRTHSLPILCLKPSAAALLLQEIRCTSDTIGNFHQQKYDRNRKVGQSYVTPLSTKLRTNQEHMGKLASEYRVYCSPCGGGGGIQNPETKYSKRFGYSVIVTTCCQVASDQWQPYE